MAFNIVASHQINSGTLNTGGRTSRTHTVNGSFLAGDMAIIFTMPNAGTHSSTYNYGLPSDFTPVTSLAGGQQTAFYGYKVLTANQTNYTTQSFQTDYNSFLAIVRGYVVKEAYVGSLNVSRTFAANDVLLLPGGAATTGFTQFGYGYDSSAQYSGAQREFTSATTYTVPVVTQYSTTSTTRTFIILSGNTVPTAPTGVSVTNSPVPNGVAPTVSWTHNDAQSDAQAKYQIRWRKAD